MNVYVASSWRNQRQPEVVSALRKAGHEVYDFRCPYPGHRGFSWSAIDPNWRKWTSEQFRKGLNHPIAQRGFQRDFAAMRTADAFVLVQPCGANAHTEIGWATGAGVPTAILLAEGAEPELMYALADRLCTSLEEVISWLEQNRLSPIPRAHSSAEGR